MIDTMLEAIADLNETAMTLTKFRNKHGAFLAKHPPFFVMTDYARITFHADDAPAVATYFGNDGWVWGNYDSAKKEIDGVTISVCCLKHRPPVYQTLVKHLEEVAEQLHNS